MITVGLVNTAGHAPIPSVIRMPQGGCIFGAPGREQLAFALVRLSLMVAMGVLDDDSTPTRLRNPNDTTGTVWEAARARTAIFMVVGEKKWFENYECR